MQNMPEARIAELYQLFLQHPKVITDSRQIEAGCMFFALRGPSFDANTFALSALQSGAAIAVVSDESLADHPQCFHVPDTLVALQKLALHHRRTWTIPVLGITGSNGKTTTKELVAAVLQTTYPVHYTKGNLNNHIGVPLTLLACPANTEIAVIEMGANKPGDIAELCAIAEPTHGLITNIGKAHLEGFGGLSGVKRTKSELYRWLQRNQGLVFVNRDEKYLTSLSRGVKKRIMYGKGSADYPKDAHLTQTSPYLAFEWQGYQVQTMIPGAYNFPNLLTAISVGSYFKVPATQIVEALERYQPNMNRSQVQTWRGAQVLMDAYNANPSSMSAALTHFAQQPVPKKVVVLGDMFELGADSEKEHQKMYRQATKTGADVLIVVGTEFGKVQRRKQDLYFANTDALRTWFQGQDWEGCHILLKGSRGMRLESLLV